MKKYFILILLTFCVMGCESRFSERPEDDKTLLWPAANSTGDSVGFINAEGKMVIPAVYSQAQINISSLPQGLYIVRAVTENGYVLQTKVIHL